RGAEGNELITMEDESIPAVPEISCNEETEREGRYCPNAVRLCSFPITKILILLLDLDIARPYRNEVTPSILDPSIPCSNPPATSYSPFACHREGIFIWDAP
ncbi:2999_t:CDS:1, partial [Acaulospora colombiana]